MDKSFWKILIADDAPEIHHISERCLSSLQYDGRSLSIFHAYTGKETVSIMAEHPDMALIFLDLVMENEHSGIDAAREIREGLANALVRIVVRTGQPDLGPANDIIETCDINDYREKTEMDPGHLRTLVVTSLRAYREISLFAQRKNALESISRFFTAGYQVRKPVELAGKTVDLLSHLFERTVSKGVFCQIKPCLENLYSQGIDSCEESIEVWEEFSLDSGRYSYSCCEDFLSFRFKTDSGQYSGKLSFTESPPLTDASVMETFFSGLSALWSNLEYQVEQERMVREKDTLLREIHHRVKNNLQIISSLLNIQSRGIKDESALEKLAQSQQRIFTMALVHEKLYHSPDMNRVEIKEYLGDLCRKLIDSSRGRKPLRLKISAIESYIDLEKAIPSGLIVNELITNAVKHGFSGEDRAGWIELVIEQGKSRIRFSIADNGKGLPPDFSLEDGSGLGMQLITLLTEQLGGSLCVDRLNPGSRFTVDFPCF